MKLLLRLMTWPPSPENILKRAAHRGYLANEWCAVGSKIMSLGLVNRVGREVKIHFDGDCLRAEESDGMEVIMRTPDEYVRYMRDL